MAKLAYWKEVKEILLSLSDVKSLSKYGLDINRLKSLTNLEYWKEVTEVYLSLEKDLLCKTKLNQADTRRLIHTMLPTIAELDFSLIDCLKSDVVLNLKVLDLSNSNKCNINDVLITLTSILDSKLDLRRLKKLNLSKNTLTDSSGVLLANEFKSLHTLLLEDTELSATDVQVLSTAAQKCYSRRLQTVNLSKNTLTDSLGLLLANEFECFHTLLLEDTKLCASDVKTLVTAASQDKLFRMTTLNLSKNTLTGTLHDLLKGNFRQLETLLLEETKLSVSDVRALSKAVQEGKL